MALILLIRPEDYRSGRTGLRGKGQTDAALAVQAAGYKTTSPNFRTIVNQTVLKDKRFKRVRRGVYQSK